MRRDVKVPEASERSALAGDQNFIVVADCDVAGIEGDFASSVAELANG